MIRLVAANGPDSFVWWDWVSRHRDDIWTRTTEHLQLTLVAVGIGLVIAGFLAVLCLRYRSIYGPVAGFTGVLYSIPSLALFAFLVPITGLGFKTAEIGLISYTLLILLRNIVAGVDGVPAAVKEAADGMGYTPWRRFVTVDLRLATPTIIAGIRIAMVTTVGLVTITALIGEGGYGAFIDEGLARRFSTPVVVGMVLSVAMAIAFDVALVAVEWAITPWARRGARHG